MTRKFKKTLVFILVLTLSFTYSTVFSFATSCSHTTTTVVTYDEYSWDGASRYHDRFIFEDTVCNNCNEVLENNLVEVSWSELHTPDILIGKWTGEHYHSGNSHYYRYYAACPCGYIDTSIATWDVHPCPGGGSSCIMPWNVEIPTVSE